MTARAHADAGAAGRSPADVPAVGGVPDGGVPDGGVPDRGMADSGVPDGGPDVPAAPRGPGDASSGHRRSGGAAQRTAGGRGPAHRDWWEARRVARAAAGRPLPVLRVPLAAACGRVLGEPLTALTDLPAFDTAAMDGWAVAGPGPWRLTGADASLGLLAGRRPEPLADGTAVRIATGAELPPGATAVLRREHGEPVGPGELRRRPEARPVRPGQDVRARGGECRRGDLLLPAGTPVTPAVLGLAAAAGHDTLPVRAEPRVELLVLGDELLESGLPGRGRVRDALGPMLPHWLRAMGAEVLGVRRIGDDAALLREALRLSPADVVLTTGGTASGPVDHVHGALAEVGGRLLVDGVRVRPGHPMLLAELPPVPAPAPGSPTGTGRHLVGLPGNPLAAAAGAVTLLEPLLHALAGRADVSGDDQDDHDDPGEPHGPGHPEAREDPGAARRRGPSRSLPLAEAAAGHPSDTRLVPVRVSGDGRAVPLPFDGPAMLRGLARAEAFAVLPPGGAAAGERVALLALPGAGAPGAGA